MGLNRLLHQIHLNPHILHGPDDAHRLLGAPALVGVDSQPDSRPYCLADSLNPVNIFYSFFSNLNL